MTFDEWKWGTDEVLMEIDMRIEDLMEKRRDCEGDLNLSKMIELDAVINELRLWHARITLHTLPDIASDDGI
jgi:hypothetical protein